ncbi:transferrin receptor 1b isoform X2 [Triplophysa rosa]|uniref:Transferrin receptor 1b n=1 Tax=Triplophysa rosa TaxID=992332 RepID=A0A9W7T8I0_TRIRA|nr:transferrin receptor 1b isoform X2 [Triplophysa rosa]KAI7792605.1 transferrin receptor 1b [Triplophysa rosa]
MAGTIDQAKMKFSKMVNSRSYTRFNQTPDGESSHVEVKMSADTEEEEMDGAEQGHIGHEMYTRSPRRPASWNKWKICASVTVVLLLVCIGFLIGYSVHHQPETPPCPLSSTQQPRQEVQPPVFDNPKPSMDWSDVVKLLNETLTAESVQKRICEYSVVYKAGSSEDYLLADKIHNFFANLHMKTWDDEHFVKLQYPSSSNPNKVMFGSEEIGSPKGFLAYSATGMKQGRVVYANYGEPQDLAILEENKLNLNGSVVLMRAGKISMAQKVANVAKKGAVAVLIYPDPADYDGMPQDTELYGHVHLGSGDPYTPGFPSFNHTQFPPTKSSGLPDILAQTITADMAVKIFNKMGGNGAPKSFQGGLSNYKLGNETDPLLTVEVNNELIDTKIHNVFGAIKGFIDTDRYVVIGAQRDSMTSGFAKSAVGTALLVELARAFSEMVKGGFRPRRSIVFASWSAGDFGNVGLTEWLEGYATSLDKKAFTYISLDGVVTGEGSFKASASPSLQGLLQKTLEKVKDPVSSKPYDSRLSLLGSYGGTLASLLKPMEMDDGAYPFLTFSGIPSVSFSFTSQGDRSVDYKYFGTALDDKGHLEDVTKRKVSELSLGGAQVAGQMALRLVHNHILKLDVTKYNDEIDKRVSAIVCYTNQLKNAKVSKSESVSTKWLSAAKGSFIRASDNLKNYMDNSNVEDLEMSRIINNRIMKVEHNLLSPYVSLRDVPFRHIFFGSGWQTASDLENYLKDVIAGNTTLDVDQVLRKFALLTWTIQGCANDLAGDIWSLDNEVE